MNMLKYFFCYRYSIVDLIFFAIAASFANNGEWLIGFMIILFGFVASSLVKLEFVDKDEG